MFNNWRKWGARVGSQSNAGREGAPLNSNNETGDQTPHASNPADPNKTFDIKLRTLVAKLRQIGDSFEAENTARCVPSRTNQIG